LCDATFFGCESIGARSIESDGFERVSIRRIGRHIENGNVCSG
jgi:hypothetical protein